MSKIGEPTCHEVGSYTSSVSQETTVEMVRVMNVFYTLSKRMHSLINMNKLTKIRFYNRFSVEPQTTAIQFSPHSISLYWPNTLLLLEYKSGRSLMG